MTQIVPHHLEKLSVKELRQLLERVDKAMPAAVAREKAETKAQIKALAAAHGMSIADLLGQGK